jgi:hypothetical protein
LYWGLAATFAFIYTVIYFRFSSPQPAFSISSDISLKAFQDNREAVVIRAGGTRRLAWATAVALIRDPGADTKFLTTALDPFHTTPPYISAFLKTVPSSDQRAVKDALASLSPVARFQAAEYMHQYFAVPRQSDKDLQQLWSDLLRDLSALRDRYELSDRLRSLGFAAQVDEKLRQAYLSGSNPMARSLIQANAKAAVNVMEVADQVLADEMQEHEKLGTAAQTWESHFHFVYFSFIALATVGFGDIVPNSVLARLAVILEVSWGIYIISMLLTTVLQPAGAAPSNDQMQRTAPGPTERRR